MSDTEERIRMIGYHFNSILPPSDDDHEKIRGRYSVMATSAEHIMGMSPYDVTVDDLSSFLDDIRCWNIKGGWGHDLANHVEKTIRRM
jgi:hypothetical protein